MVGMFGAFAGVSVKPTHEVVRGELLCVIGVLACGLWLPRFVRYDARQFVAAIASP